MFVESKQSSDSSPIFAFMAVPLPHRQDRLRSAPGTSYIDPRGVSGHDLDSAFQQARLGLNPDYFSDSPRYDGIRPHSPFHPGVGRLESEFGSSFRGSEASLEDHVRRTNLAVALANSQVSSRARYALLHPMTTSDGRFPEDFNVPKTVESVSQFDSRYTTTNCTCLVKLF